jgi:hypothetical protein
MARPERANAAILLSLAERRSSGTRRGGGARAGRPATPKRYAKDRSHSPGRATSCPNAVNRKAAQQCAERLDRPQFAFPRHPLMHRPDFRANAALFLRPPTPQRRTKQYSETDCQRNSEDQRCKRQSIEFQASDPSTIQCIAKYFRLETLAATTVF